MKVLLKPSLLFLENQDNNVSKPLLLLSAMLIEPSNILRLVFHLQVVLEVCLLAWVVLEVCHQAWVELGGCHLVWVVLERCLLVWVVLAWVVLVVQIQVLQLSKHLSKTLLLEPFVNE